MAVDRTNVADRGARPIALVAMALLAISLLTGMVITDPGKVQPVGVGGFSVIPTGVVSQDARNIQQALDDATAGATVVLKTGTFNIGDEQLSFTKSVTLRGENEPVGVLDTANGVDNRTWGTKINYDWPESSTTTDGVLLINPGTISTRVNLEALEIDGITNAAAGSRFDFQSSQQRGAKV